MGDFGKAAKQYILHYVEHIEIYKMIQAFNIPLEEDGNICVKYILGDKLIIIKELVYCRDRNLTDDDDDVTFSQVILSPEFVRVNEKLFTKIG